MGFDDFAKEVQEKADQFANIMKEKAPEVADKTKEWIDQAQEKAPEIIDQVKESANEFVVNAKELVDGASSAAQAAYDDFKKENPPVPEQKEYVTIPQEETDTSDSQK